MAKCMLKETGLGTIREFAIGLRLESHAAREEKVANGTTVIGIVNMTVSGTTVPMLLTRGTIATETGTSIGKEKGEKGKTHGTTAVGDAVTGRLVVPDAMEEVVIMITTATMVPTFRAMTTRRDHDHDRERDRHHDEHSHPDADSPDQTRGGGGRDRKRRRERSESPDGTLHHRSSAHRRRISVAATTSTTDPTTAPAADTHHPLPPEPRAVEKDEHTLEREARNRERMLKEQQRREAAMLEAGAPGGGEGGSRNSRRRNRDRERDRDRDSRKDKDRDRKRTHVESQYTASHLVLSFVWGLVAAACAGGITTFSLYAPFFLRDLHYSQYMVNTVAIVAEVAMYLFVSVFGYLCDRYTPRPISLMAGALFGTGYLGAAMIYEHGRKQALTGDRDSPQDQRGTANFAWMLLAFACIGLGTCAMYLAAVTTCAKNFGKGRYKGLMLALPISAFGISGMWQAQLAARVFTRPAVAAPSEHSTDEDDARELDPRSYFIFLGVLLSIVGSVGAFALRVADEEELIDEAVEDLERSGMVVPPSRRQSACGHDASGRRDYGALATDETRRERRPSSGKRTPSESLSSASQGLLSSPQESTVLIDHDQEEREKKTWLLNYETSQFLRDETMWLLAVGFLFVTGPSEAYINNVGTIIDTLKQSRGLMPLVVSSPGLASTHVSIIALSSTVARLLVGTMSDLFAPTPVHPHPQQPKQSAHEVDGEHRHQTGREEVNDTVAHGLSHSHRSRLTFSRMYILCPSLLVLLAGYLLLSTSYLHTHASLLKAVTAVIGTGYGASFSLVPIIIAVVWGVENFGTNWGIVAMFPAVGAAFWGMIYSVVYDQAARRSSGGGENGHGEQDGECVGWQCYGAWAVGSTVSVAIAIGFCGMAWWKWRRRGVIV
ncbi:putative monocarboxylate transporter mch1 [Ascosphaera acerosa]|nr:putative monocarboxylate transporter mch1 [Ascosphaera acerosa]